MGHFQQLHWIFPEELGAHTPTCAGCARSHTYTILGDGSVFSSDITRPVTLLTMAVATQKRPACLEPQNWLCILVYISHGTRNKLIVFMIYHPEFGVPSFDPKHVVIKTHEGESSWNQPPHKEDVWSTTINHPSWEQLPKGCRTKKCL